MCLVILVLDIRLNTLTFLFLILSGTKILAYGSLIVLQLPLHLSLVLFYTLDYSLKHILKNSHLENCK